MGSGRTPRQHMDPTPPGIEFVTATTVVRPGSPTRKAVNFLGVCVDALTYDEMFDLVDKWIRNKAGRSHHIACINAYCVTLARKDPHLARIYNGADIVGPDGMPFVRWIQAIHHEKCDRFAAPDIILQLAERARTTGYTFYLYGGAPNVVAGMKKFLEQRFPFISIVGYRSPPFRSLTTKEDEIVCTEINRLKPDIVCVGLGTPKQDYWIEEHISKIRGSVLIASGATFDFFGGRIKIAPAFIRRSGFEWLYRLMSKDFPRLWRRYTVLNAIFLWQLLLQVLRIRSYEWQRWSHLDDGDRSA